MTALAPLDKLRQGIDDLDAALLKMLNQRAALALDIGRVKNAQKLDIADPLREQKVITRLLDLNQGPLPPEAVENIFREIIKNCRQIQNPAT